MTLPLFVLPDHGRGRAGESLHSTEGVRAAYAQRQHGLWLAPSKRGLSLVADAIQVGSPRHNFLSFDELTPSWRALLDALFVVVLAPESGTRLLARDELDEVLRAENAQDLFVGARWISEADSVLLYRGDLSALRAPSKMFRTRPGGPTPDFAKAAVVDYGQTLRLGTYEASTDAILYELDPNARKRAKSRALSQDETVGGAIRRLRLQRGLRLEDFEPLVSAKTVGRAERGEFVPRAGTLSKIAKKLGVDAGSLGTF